MKNEFDSRTLSFTDAYGQRFMKAGRYKYHIHPAASKMMVNERPFSVKVVDAPRGHKMEQHTVMVEVRGKSFAPPKSNLTIKVGDIVLWCCRNPQAPLFQVSGSKEFFSSGQLSNECGYAHAFGVAGEYHWVDAFGGGASGTVRVHAPKSEADKELDKWKRKLKKGSLVMINGGKTEPAEIDIDVGQTVYFAIIRSEGMSITDTRLTRTVKAVPCEQKA